MKQIKNACLALLAFVAVSCMKPYELKLELALSRDEIKASFCLGLPVRGRRY